MARSYRIIDADGHVLEPLDLWDQYMEPAYRERAPQLFVDTDGKERLRLEGKVLGGPTGLGLVGAIGARQGEASIDISYSQGRQGGFDPHARIPDMDLDGIDAAFLYPSIGLFAGAVDDPPLAAAMCRAYNRWLADYCQPYPNRLFGVAMLPMQSVELAIEEARYARKELGMRGGFLRPNPYNGRMLHHPDYEPFWAEVQDLDFAIGLHEGSGGGMPQVGSGPLSDPGRAAHHFASDGNDAGLPERHLERGVRALSQSADRVSGVGRGLDCALARPHGPPLRRQEPVHGPLPADAAQRVFRAAVLDFV